MDTEHDCVQADAPEEFVAREVKGGWFNRPGRGGNRGREEAYRARKAKYREAHRAKVNAYQKRYMAERRAAAKAAKLGGEI